MTPEQALTLRQPYRWADLRHPDGMSYSFMQFLDDVRAEYGWPLNVTSDFRTPEENTAAGGVADSRHLVGQAVDVAFPPTANHLWLLVEAIFKYRRAAPIELELVDGLSAKALAQNTLSRLRHELKREPTAQELADGIHVDQHVHVAWKRPGQASALIVAAE